METKNQGKSEQRMSFYNQILIYSVAILLGLMIGLIIGIEVITLF